MRAISPAPGSSPLARGLLKDNRAEALKERIIPARAGFTQGQPRRGAEGEDHPRSRGVYWWSGRYEDDPVGSSPLARGLRMNMAAVDPDFGIIPARAGFTGGCTCSGGRARDHPRSRGVYPGKGIHMGRILGSSPLARDLPSHQWPALMCAGIIPARAGFTRRARRSATSPPGSSPLARGLPARPGRVREAHRIIPARAGFTPASTASRPPESDHPRSRGVYEARARSRRRVAGSSPLARGLPESIASKLGITRIIPARAGFTPPRT